MIVELLLFALSVCLLTLFLVNKNHQLKGLPPGPWGLPILGHLPLLGFQPHKKLMALRKIYGPIIFIRFGSIPSIVLQDAKMIKEAFGNSNFAGRPYIKAMHDGGFGKGINMSEGPAHLEQRQFVMKFLKDLGATQKGQMTLKIHEEVQTLLEFLQRKEGQLTCVKHLFQTYVVNALWAATMSEKFDYDDPQIDHFAHLITTRLSGTVRKIPNLSILWPQLGNWFPELSGHNDMVSALKEINLFIENLINKRKLTWVKDQPRDFTDAFLDKVADTEDESSSFHAKQDFQKYATGELFIAATETASSTLEWFLYYMGKDPMVQSKLQKEIDAVVGHHCLPTLSQRPSCPYAEATVNELLRISTVVPFGIFHRTVANVEFHGYKIPANTVVTANAYGVHHDEGVWGDPENFRPERFLGEDGRLKKMEHFIPFSSGKRSCIGEGFARDELFLFTTSLCQKFTIELEPGTPQLVAQFGFTLTPPKFRVKFVERL